MNINDEFTKEVIDMAYEAIELAKKSGKIRKGTNETTKAIERGTAKLVVAAKDVDPKEVIMHLPALCEEKDVMLVIVPNKQDLGAAAGLNVGTGAVAIVQEGEAKATLKKIISALGKKE